MITTFRATLPVSVDQALNALADRGFLFECVPDIRLEAGNADELLRGTFTCGTPVIESTYQFGLRLVDFDADGRSMRYEALARQVDGRGLASLTVDLDVKVDGERTSLVVNACLEIVGIDSSDSYVRIEQTVADRLVAFGSRVAALLGENPDKTWHAPGVGPLQTPAALAAEPVRAKAAVSPIAKRVILPLGAIGGTTLFAYLIWRVIRVVGIDGRLRGADS